MSWSNKENRPVGTFHKLIDLKSGGGQTAGTAAPLTVTVAVAAAAPATATTAASP